VTYYILRGFQALGLIWDIKEPPARVYDVSRQLQGARPIRAAAPVAAAPDLTPGE
jgi:hypothetical protein